MLQLKTRLLAAISQCPRPSSIKDRRYAAILVELFGRQKLSELKNFIPETIAVRSSFFSCQPKKVTTSG